jgi:holo-[acyl-carrier protein] synthase
MAIIGIGTDIVKVSRIKRLFKKYPEGFAGRILHKRELEILKTHKMPKSFLAKRFCAKEAVSKALGTGIAQGISFQDIEISNNPQGQPQLTLHGETLAIANKLGVKRHFLSLSDEEKYAIAYVILEGD